MNKTPLTAVDLICEICGKPAVAHLAVREAKAQYVCAGCLSEALNSLLGFPPYAPGFTLTSLSTDGVSAAIMAGWIAP